MAVQFPSPREIENRIVTRIMGRRMPLTDYTPIAVIRMLVRAMIVEEYASLWRGLAEAQTDWFVQSARGAVLDRRLADYGLTRPGGTIAYGRLLVTVTTATNLQAGLIVITDPQDGSEPKKYRVRQNASPEAGDLGDGSWNINVSRLVDIEAMTVGAGANTAAGTITRAENPIPGLESVSNPSAIANGQDSVGDSEYRQYFADYWQSLTRGTRPALLFHLRNFTDPNTLRRVASIAIEEWGGSQPLASDTGPVALKIYIDEGIGSAIGGTTAHPTLVQAVQRAVDGEDAELGAGLRAAGVPTAVQAAIAVPLPLELVVDVDRGFPTERTATAVRNALSIHVARLPVGGYTLAGDRQGQVSFARLFKTVLDVPGVLKAEFSRPTADFPIGTGQKAVISTMTVVARQVA